MGTKIEYKGPSVHTRVLTRKDFERDGVEFGEGVTVRDMVWEADASRRPVSLPEDLEPYADQMVEFVFSKDPAFKVWKDGETVKDSHPDAAHVNPDGSDIDGNGGSEALRQALQPGDTFTS